MTCVKRKTSRRRCCNVFPRDATLILATALVGAVGIRIRLALSHAATGERCLAVPSEQSATPSPHSPKTRILPDSSFSFNSHCEEAIVPPGSTPQLGRYSGDAKVFLQISYHVWWPHHDEVSHTFAITLSKKSFSFTDSPSSRPSQWGTRKPFWWPAANDVFTQNLVSCVNKAVFSSHAVQKIPLLT